MSSTDQPTPRDGPPLLRAAQVIIITSVMFTFISYWRTAAVVLCDLASTAYYIGGIVEQAIGPAAPWYILAVMLFSYAVRWVYIESCTLFVRGGVYRVVKSAMGGGPAKLAVSALIFDYLLTGPISGVSAGQYLVGLVLDSLALIDPGMRIGDEDTRDAVRRWGSVIIACAITLYFYRQNLIGIHESSDKAVKIMIATTIMAAIMLVWCGVTLALHGPRNRVPFLPDLSTKVEYEVGPHKDRVTGEEKEMWQRHPETGQFLVQRDDSGQPIPKLNDITGKPEDPLGFLPSLFPSLAEKLRQPGNWLSVVGLIGLLIAFGHSILAMSGEETLAQVYREVESPKLQNFKKAAFIVFVFSLLLTATISFLAVLLIPDEIRMKEYRDNLISGLAMYVAGPAQARLLLSAGVVVVGSFILAGAVNTAIIGSNGVLNRVAEDGVMPDWFLKPHRRYGTTNRILLLIVGLQLLIIIVSRGHTLLLGEAYAFGVVWSFVFQALSMVVLRFRDRRPREFKVPLNVRIGDVEVPIGLILILLFLLSAAVLNFLTKEVATVSGLVFTLVFFTIFSVSERYHQRRLKGKRHEHLEQFNQRSAAEATLGNLKLTRPFRKLVAIRSPQNLFMLEKALAETDPETTDVIVMTAKVAPEGELPLEDGDLDRYDQQLMTAVVQRAEKAGKQVTPLIVPTNNPLYAVIRTAKDLHVQELVMGASNKYNADEQLEQIAFYWIDLCQATTSPLTVRILGRERDVHLDLGGGSRIPKLSERQARSVAELRAAGVGVHRILLVHHGTLESRDLFQAVLTMLDPQVPLTLVSLATGTSDIVEAELDRAKKLDRDVEVRTLRSGPPTAALLKLIQEDKYDLLIVGVPPEQAPRGDSMLEVNELVRSAPCRVFVASPPAIPLEPEPGPEVATEIPAGVDGT